MEQLKDKARAAGLWNLFLPQSKRGAGLTNLEYAPLCEIMGRSPWRRGLQLQCARHRQHGNLERYGTTRSSKRVAAAAARRRDPLGLRDDRARGGLVSDATNIASRIERDGDHYVINGRKWWTSGAPDPRCRISSSWARPTPTTRPPPQQSMVLVPMDTPGVTRAAPAAVFGYDDAPHGHGEVDVQGRARAGGQHPARRRAAASRSPRAGWARAASTTACA
jgi:acyl-CoA dehydrogenase